MRRLLAGAFALSVITLPAPAQEPAIVASLERFRDSLDRVEDGRSLRRLAERLHREASRTDDPLLACREGLAWIRVAEKTSGRRYDEADRAFRRAADRAPRWAYPWLGRGLAKAGKGAWHAATPANLGNRVGVGAIQDAVGFLQQALERDRGLAPALVALADLWPSLLDTAALGPTLEALRRAEGTAADRDPAVWLARSRLEWLAGDPWAALRAAETHLALGGPRGVGLHALALARMRAHHPDAESAYFAGAALDEAGGVAAYRDDLVPVVGDSGLAAFDATAGGQRAAWLRRFWSDRDRWDLREDGERLREHYRRLRLARVRYRLEYNRRYYGQADRFRSGSLELDDRGIVFVRYGEPTVAVAPMFYGMQPNASWKYARGEGDLVLHFSGGGTSVRGGGLTDLRLVPSVFDLRRDRGAPEDMMLESRAEIDPDYAKYLMWGGLRRARFAHEDAQRGLRSIAQATTSDSHELRFERPLEPRLRVLALGRLGARRLLHVVFSIPTATRDSAERLPDGGLPVRLRLAAFDAEGRHAFSVDSSAALRPPDAGQSAALGRIAFPIPDGVWHLRLALEQGDRGRMLPTDSVRAASTAPGVVRLSDLAVGDAGRDLAWHAAPGDTAYLSPYSAFARAVPLELYYEVEGLRLGESYETVVELVPRATPGLLGRLLGHERRGLSLRFQDEHRGGTARVRRTLDVRRLEEAGLYLLKVTVTAAGGRREERGVTVELQDGPLE